jgi:hypothetical protein
MKRGLVIAALIFHCAPAVFSDDRSDAATSAAEKRLATYAERVGGTFRQTFEAASQVEVKNGIGEYEAYVLSAAYLYAYIERCSSIHALLDQGDRWLAETRVGQPPGDPGPLIYVEKATGITYSPKNKRVVDPKSYLKVDI